jgi:hypothetical protein
LFVEAYLDFATRIRFHHPSRRMAFAMLLIRIRIPHGEERVFARLEP